MYVNKHELQTAARKLAGKRETTTAITAQPTPRELPPFHPTQTLLVVCAIVPMAEAYRIQIADGNNTELIANPLAGTAYYFLSEAQAE